MKPTSLTIHNTSNDASARNEIAYMVSNNMATAYHEAIDDIENVRSISHNRMAFHAGDGSYGKGNNTSIGLEICYSLSGGSRFTKAEINGAHRAAAILHERGWTTKQMVQHHHWTGKNCPMETRKRGWTRFVKMVDAELAKLKKPVKPLYKVVVNSKQTGAYSTLTNAKKKLGKTIGKITLSNKTVFENKKPVAKPLYKVVVSGKQTGAYSTLANAKGKLGSKVGIITLSGKTVFQNKTAPKPVAKPTPTKIDVAQDKDIEAVEAVNKKQDDRLDSVEKDISWIRELLTKVAIAFGFKK